MKTALFLALLAVTLPDLRTGNVNGLTGWLFWPAHPNKPNGDPDPWESAERCAVHAFLQSDPDRELLYPCGKWFVFPEPGRYRYWLESDGQMTPVLGLLIYAHKPFNGGGLGSVVPLTPAGRLAIPTDRKLGTFESLRLLSIEAKDSWSDRVFERRLFSEPVQMPAGRVVAGRYDRATNDAIALSRPVDVKPGATIRVWPAPPRDSDLLVVLAKTPELQLPKSIVSLSLDQKPPDVLLNGFERILAIWYDLDLPRATLSLKSDVAFWEAREVRFTRGKVTTLRGELQPLPKARVTINAPLDAPRLSLEVKRPAEAKAIKRVDVRAGVHEIESLPAEALRLTLQAGEWRMNKDVDLRSGQDTSVVFDLQPINVRGTVYYGEEPARAEIEFLNDDEWRAVKTNERGEYETTLWWPGVYTTRVKISGPPFLDPFREIFQSGSVDFHVPRTDYVVHVRDATTHQGIAGARVTAGSVTEGGLRSAQHVITDEEGTAVLPPLRKGELFVDVRADRYVPRQEPLRLIVDEEHHELDIELQPHNIVGTLRFVLPNGAPAAYAEAWAFNDAMQPLWRGMADLQGELGISDVVPNALLIVRHQNAASTIRRVDLHENTWALEPPAEPVTFVSERKNTLVSLWLDGVKLSGPALLFASWSTMMMTNPEGIWTGRNLPGKPLKIDVEPPTPKN